MIWLIVTVPVYVAVLKKLRRNYVTMTVTGSKFRANFPRVPHNIRWTSDGYWCNRLGGQSAATHVVFYSCYKYSV